MAAFAAVLAPALGDAPALEAARAFAALHTPSAEPDLAPKIVMRLTRGPVAGCTRFHVDGDAAAYARQKTQTVQLALNDDADYEGGRLCFVTGQGELHIPERPAGTLTIHGPRILHAVTRLTAGSRYGLFLLDKFAGLGDDQVVKAGEEEAGCVAREAREDAELAGAGGVEGMQGVVAGEDEAGVGVE